MTTKEHSKRERQIMLILHRMNEASAKQVMEELSDPPTYSTVRALLKRMLDKQLITSRQDGQKLIYSPSESKDQAATSAISRVMKTFFNNSAANAVNALIGSQKSNISKKEIEEIERLIQKIKEEKS